MFSDFEKMFNEMFNGFNPDGFKRKTYTSKDGLLRFTYITNVPDGNTRSDLQLLKDELEDAIEKQDFELAVELRDKIKTLELNADKIKKLNDELSNCIKTQNFERAIELRDEIKSLTEKK
jgi:protein-arginine kinase activator protein McsA